jgi:outer membrane receptor for ferrienterochelin and colicin
MKSLIYITLVIMAARGLTNAQSGGELYAKVTTTDGRPLPEVSVTLSDGEVQIKRATTNEAGEAVFSSLDPGVYVIAADTPGYFGQKKTGIIIRSGQTGTVTFTLKRMFPPLRIQVTADRMERTARFTPASTGAVDSEELNSRPIRTFDQAIESVSGVQVNRTSPITTSSISIRGSSESQGGGTGNRILLLLDGRPAMNPDVGSANWNLIPIGIIDRVEIVKGATSPLYGSFAMGGVVNVITKTPGERLTAGISAETGFYEKPAEWMRWTEKRAYYSVVQGYFAKKQGKFGLIGHVSRQADTGYKENNDVEFYTGYGKIRHEFGKTDANRLSKHIDLSVGGGKSENGRPHAWESPLRPLSVEQKDANDKQHKLWGDIDLAFELPLTERVKSKGHLYYHRNETRTAYNPDGLKEDPQPAGFETKSISEQYGVIVQAEHIWGDSQRFLGGGDASIETVNGTPENLSYGRHRAGSTAVFIMSETYLPFRLTVTGAVRYDYRKILGAFTEGQTNPRVGLVFKPTERTAIRTSYSTAFRTPTFAEMFLKEVPSGHIFRPNPDLRAEHLRAYEVGINQDFTDRINIDAVYFRHKYYDMISWDLILAGGESVLIPYNRDVAIMQGIDVGLFADLFWGIRAKASYVYLIAEDRTAGAEDEALPYKPRHQLYLGGDWFLRQRLLLHAEARYRSGIEEVVLYPESPPDAFILVNAKATYRLPKGFSVNFAVNNVGNKQYEEVAKYRMPGRSYTLGLAWELQ